jgi:hypothetical protein
MSEQQHATQRPRFWTHFWAAVALSLLAALFVRQSWLGSASLNDPRAGPRNIAARGELSAGEKSTIAVFREASPSVVHITAIAIYSRSISTRFPKAPAPVLFGTTAATSSPTST